MRFTALAVAGLAAALSTAAFAQDAAPAPVCAETMEHVVSILDRMNVGYIILSGEDIAAFAEQVAPITGVPAADVTGALIAGFDVPAFGLQTKDGCFSPQPIPLVQAAGVKA